MIGPQQAIGHYRITSKIGEGGMGEVWRATDTRLGREVAIKVLPDRFAQHADRMARFTREAQVLASLNHPNIASIYGVEDRALIMEFVPGPTLAERIAQAPIPWDQALPIATQIAEALEYAHERGIVHRDLKPANVKVTPEGRVKLLDFGLAKAMSTGAPAGDPKSSPTLTMRDTAEGVILGTAAYMAPEQARGQNLDARADIWAFGVVLYEMLTGGAPFAGPTISDTVAAVLKTEPDLSAIPAHVRPVLQRCLRKDPRRRSRCIGDVRMALEEGLAEAPPTPGRSRVMPWAVAAVLAIGCAAGWLVAWRATRPVDHPLIRLSVDLGPDAVPGLNLTAAISPDGRRLVFPARGPDGVQQLATRLLDESHATLLPRTGGGADPFFSPDGQWIGFFVHGRLEKTSVQGGSPVTVCAVSTYPFGASWSEDGSIVAATGLLRSLWWISAASATPKLLTKLAPGESTHRWPQVLPGGKAVLFTASRAAANQEDDDIQAISLKDGRVRVVRHAAYYGRYVPGGYVLYVSRGVLFGIKFDPERLETAGAPVPLLEDVASNPATGGGQFDFSTNGTFIFSEGKSAAPGWQIGWLDRSGRIQPLLTAPRAYGLPRLSGDRRKLAFSDRGDIYVYDLQRDTTAQVTFTGGRAGPFVWAPDAKHIAFQSGVNRLAWIRVDGGEEAQVLLDSPSTTAVWSFSPDGRRLAYFASNPNTGFDVWTLPMDLSDPDHPKPGKPEPFVRTAAEEMLPIFSPDGRWIAYRSNESGIFEIYVRPFPAGSGGRWPISSGGGLYAFWSNNGRELFFETADNRIMVVDYTVEGNSFVPGKPRLWSERQLFFAGTSNLDLAPDGNRFAVLALPDDAPGQKQSVHVTVLLNFFDELKRRIP